MNPRDDTCMTVEMGNLDSYSSFFRYASVSDFSKDIYMTNQAYPT